MGDSPRFKLTFKRHNGCTKANPLFWVKVGELDVKSIGTVTDLFKALLFSNAGWIFLVVCVKGGPFTKISC